MAAPKSILVIGYGELGREVVQSLAVHPARSSCELSVLLRERASDPAQRGQQLDELRGWNVQTRAGDIVGDSVEQLAALFLGQHTVICCSGMVLDGEMQVKVARAALAAGVQRYFPWQFGIDYDAIGRGSGQDLFDRQLDVRELLRGQTATEFCIVSVGMFIPFLFEPAFGLVDARRTTVTAIGSWDNSLTVTSAADIGRVTAELALAHPAVNGVVYVAGDTVSMRDVADILGRALGRDPERILKSVPDLERDLAEQPADGMRKYRLVFGRGVGVSWDKRSSFNEKIGMQMQTVAAWVQANLRVVSPA